MCGRAYATCRMAERTEKAKRAVKEGGYERGDGMTRLTTLISFCLGAIIARAMRIQDYFILTFALIAFAVNIAVACLIER